VAASCDVVSDDGFGVQLARFNPIGLSAGRPAEPVYAAGRDPREAPTLRALLDALTGAGDVWLAGPVPWARQPEFYREHTRFVTASADQAREQLACGARVVMIGGAPVAGASTPGPDTGAVRAALAAPARSWDEIIAGLREICATHATPARLGALAALAGLGDHTVAGRQIAVLAQADDAAAAAGLATALGQERLTPAEVVVVVGREPAGSEAELACRAATAALSSLADRGVRVRAIPGGPGEPGWLRQAAGQARSPWVAPWPPRGAMPDGASGSYLLDLVCARECSQADAVGWAGAAYEFTTSLEPALARRDHVAQSGQGPRLFSVS
jgi:hypothetical protein